MINLITNLKIDNYLNEDQLNYGINFVNWFQMHNDQEKIAMDICSHMKISIIPVFVQLARIYKDLFEKQTLSENELIFDCTKLADTNVLLGHLLEDFQQKYSNTIKLNPVIDLNSLIMNGLLSRPDFKTKKWMRIFNICELSACKILYSMIAFLDQNLFISSNMPIREHDNTADYFFHKNLENFIKENFNEINYIILKDKYRSYIRRPFKRIIKYILRFVNYLTFKPAIFYQPMINTITDLLFNLFQNELKQMNRTKIDSFKNFQNSEIAEVIKNEQTKNIKSNPKKINQTSTLNIELDQDDDLNNFDSGIDDLLGNDDKKNNQSKNEQNGIAENRCYLVVDQARVSVTEFCVQSLKSLTGTLFHFWVIKEPLTDGDIEVLKEYKDVFEGIQDDVYSALHKYLLSTQLKLRPYGFIMNSALFDNLPSDFWARKKRIEMRTWLQECISIFLNWNFEFITVYPRPIQAQYTKMCYVSNVYQSMIESLIDFKVILVLANQLNNQINRCFYDEKASNFEHKLIKKPKFFKTNINPKTQLPWTLIKHLESNFVCKEIDIKIKQTINNKILPSILINEEKQAVGLVNPSQADFDQIKELNKV